MNETVRERTTASTVMFKSTFAKLGAEEEKREQVESERRKRLNKVNGFHLSF